MKIIQQNAYKRFKYENGEKVPIYEYNIILSKNCKLYYFNFEASKNVDVDKVIKKFFC